MAVMEGFSYRATAARLAGTECYVPGYKRFLFKDVDQH
jgi:hypothetical protein